MKRIESILAPLSSWPLVMVSGLGLSVSLYGMLAKVPVAGYGAYVAVLISGIPLVYIALRRLFTERSISSALLISIAMVACIMIGESFAAGEVAFIMALGEKLEDITVARARKGVAALVNLLPRIARQLIGSEVHEIPAESVAAGDVLRVLPGEVIPADGDIIDGASSVNQSAMTGESLPVDKKVGDSVFAGTINGHGCIDICATRPAKDTTLQHLIRLVREADARKAPLQRTVDRWASWLVPIALLLAVMAYFLTGNLERAVTVLVVFCPCALALATPTSVIAAIGQATRYGVLIKSGEALERMARVSCLATDKTGTLTFGKLMVSDIIPLSSQMSEHQLLAFAAAVECRSEHPIAKAIVNRALQLNLRIPQAIDFRMIPGVGVEGVVEGRPIFCGKVTAEDVASAPGLQSLQLNGKATLSVKCGTEILGVIALTDRLRPGAETMVQQLQNNHCRVILLTGDHAAAAEHVARQVSIHEVHASLLPADKLRIISAEESSGGRVCMLGDGVNDAPALRQAYIGIAMGGMGSEIARDAADITLMTDDLTCVPYIKRLADATLNTIRFNLTVSMLINIVAITLSVMGVLGPVSGALVHNAGSVLVVLNAALLYERKFR